LNGLPNALEMTERQIENFLKKIDKTLCGCWLWTGSLIPIGYGKVGINHKTYLAHRVAYQIFKGEIPGGLGLDHFYCQTRRCVNPDHLEPVTQKVNLLRGNTFNAVNAAKTHCPKGHPYDAANTRIGLLKNGVKSRSCIACNKDKGRIRHSNQHLLSEVS
jgi:hypothetical protein